jgi:hypothetical protein
VTDPIGPGPGESRSEAQLIAEAVLGVDGVVALSAGPVGQFRSYLPGGRSVPGVRLDEDRVAVNVICRYGPALTDLGVAVASALQPLRGGRAVDVTVDDLVLPGEDGPDRSGSVVEDAGADGAAGADG